MYQIDDSDDNDDDGVLVRKASHGTASSAAWFAQAQFAELEDDLDDLDAPAPSTHRPTPSAGAPAAKRAKSTREQALEDLDNEQWAHDMGLQLHKEDLDEDSDAIVTSDEEGEGEDGEERDMAGLATRSQVTANSSLDEFAQLDVHLGNDTKQLAVDQAVADQRSKTPRGIKANDSGGGFEEVPADTPVDEGEQGLDAVGLALATEMLVRNKRRDIIEGAYNRWAHNDDPMPMWFDDEEQGHREGILPMTKEMAEEIKQRMREINARPLKKVVEAKARKKAKMNRQMGKLTKKAEDVMGNDSMTGKRAWCMLW